MSDFNMRLKELREQRGYYQKDLAALAGITVRAYQLYEQGKTEPGIDVLIRFADLLQVPLDYLVGRYSLTDAVESQTNPPKSPNG